MVFEKKDYVEFQNLRLGEYAYNKENIFMTEVLPVNNSVYNKIVSKPNFYAINTLSILYLIRRANKIGIINFNLSNNRKELFNLGLKILTVSMINYTVFYRSYRKEYPFNTDIKNKITNKNKFEKVLNSIIDPIYVLQKDVVILRIIFLFCIPFYKPDELLINTDNQKEIESVTKIQILENDIKKNDSNLTTYPLENVIKKKELSKEKIRAGKFL